MYGECETYGKKTMDKVRGILKSINNNIKSRLSPNKDKWVAVGYSKGYVKDMRKQGMLK